MNLYEKAAELVRSNTDFAIATIVEAKGSTPRHSGKMIVLADGTIFGTIGGGEPEYLVIREAADVIRSGRSRMTEYVLDEKKGGLAMHCGGSMKIWLEAVSASPSLVLIGAGHVGLALSKLAAFLGYRITVIDDRPEYGWERYPDAEAVYIGSSVSEAVKEAFEAGVFTKESAAVIATKDSDLEALFAAVRCGAGYIGMIGSRRKTAYIMECLRQRGIEEELLANVYAPIGLDIGSETPEEIALSVMAEIIAVRNGRPCGHMKERR